MLRYFLSLTHEELEALGVIDDRRPKFIAVQSEATAPVVDAFNSNTNDSKPTEAGETIATGINVPDGVGHFKVLDTIKKSCGAAISVSEMMIQYFMHHIYTSKAIWICPEGAATLAALETAYDMGLINSGSRVVVFNTGSFEKYLPEVRKFIFSSEP